MLSLAERVLGLNGRELRRAFPAVRLPVPDHGQQRGEQGGARRAVPGPLPRHRPALRRHRHRRPGRRRRQRLPLDRPSHQPAQPAGRQHPVLRRQRRSCSGPGRRSSVVESGALFIAIYIWVGVFSVLAPSQVWTLANYVMTTREAKRSFGFIGSGAILGWIVGGFATRDGGLALRHREHAGASSRCRCSAAPAW